MQTALLSYRCGTYISYSSFCYFSLSTIIDSASHLPHKTPVYGTLAALLNEAFPKSFGSGLSERVVKYLESAYNAGDFTRAKVTLRFIGSMCMAQMFSGDDWMELANAAIGMAKVSEDSFIADCYTYTVLGSLPWVRKMRLCIHTSKNLYRSISR